jgi:hypothetical protein
VTTISARQQGRVPTARLLLLHLVSRRIPAAVVALAACGVVLRIGLHWHWISGTGPDAEELPVVVEGAAAAVIAIATASPFGEPERATGRWLPYLRLADALVLTLTAAGVLAAGAAAAGLPGGTLAIARNVAGLAGLSLLSSAVIGGMLAWIGPMVFALVADYAILEAWTTPWMWPARPPHDRGAAFCAALALALGLAVTTLHGARDPAHE